MFLVTQVTMFIAQNHSGCNSAWWEIINIPQLIGNIVPSYWYHQLLLPCGKSDTTVLAILSELLFFYCYNGNSEFQLNFS